MISLEKLRILMPLQKLLNNVSNLGKLIVAKGFAINRPIWSHCSPHNFDCIIAFLKVAM